MSTRLILIDPLPPTSTAHGNLLLDTGHRLVHFGEIAANYEPRVGDLVLFAGTSGLPESQARFQRLQQRVAAKGVPLLVLKASPNGCVGDARLDVIRAGANDVIDVSGNLEELALKIASYTRLLDSAGWRIEIGRLVIDLKQQLVHVEEERIELTSTELRLLVVLAESDGAAISRETLLSNVWGYSARAQTRTLDTHIKRLREKLGRHADYVRTVRGLGYAVSDPTGMFVFERVA